MFDLTAGTIDRPFRDKHATAITFSIASHVLGLGSVVAIILFAVTDTPRLPAPMMAFVAELPAALPPPPPPPPTTVRAQRQTQPQPAPSSEPAFIAPPEAPTGIQPETAIDLGGEGGVVGGVEGGLPDGVVGGIPGGIVVGPPPPPPPPAPPAKAVRIGGAIQQPALLFRVEPRYPPVAVSAKVKGIVILEATVNEQGEVTKVEVLRSTPLLDVAAVEAIKQWRYQPLMMNGAPSPFILVVTLTFSFK